MNILVSFLTLDRMYLWSQYAVYIFGGIALITGKMVNDRQALKIETLRNENLKLEAAVSPRSFKDQPGAAKRLMNFANVKAVITHSPDVESQRAAGQIALVLIAAKWDLPSAFRPPTESLMDGVIIGVNRQRVPSSQEEVENAKRLVGASEAHAEELNKTSITAHTMPMGDEAPPDVILIQVGFKPNPMQ